MNAALFSKNRQSEVNRFLTILLNRNDPALGRSLHRRPTSNNYPLSISHHSLAYNRRIKRYIGKESNDNNAKGNPPMTIGYRQQRNAIVKRDRALRSRRLYSLRRRWVHTHRRARRAIMTRKGKRKIIKGSIGANTVRQTVICRTVSQYLPSHGFLVKKFHFAKLSLADPSLIKHNQHCSGIVAENQQVSSSVVSLGSVINSSHGTYMNMVPKKTLNLRRMQELKAKAGSFIKSLNKNLMPSVNVKTGDGVNKKPIMFINQTLKIKNQNRMQSNNMSHKFSVAKTPVRVATKLCVSKQRTALLRTLMYRCTDPKYRGNVICEASHKYNFSQIILRDSYNDDDSYDNVSLLGEVARSLESICGGRVKFSFGFLTSSNVDDDNNNETIPLSIPLSPFEHQLTRTVTGFCSFTPEHYHSAVDVSKTYPVSNISVTLSQIRVDKRSGLSVFTHSSETDINSEKNNNENEHYNHGTCKDMRSELKQMGSVFILSGSPMTMYSISQCVSNAVNNANKGNLIDHIHHCSVWAAVSPLTCEICLHRFINEVHTDATYWRHQLVIGVSSLEVLCPGRFRRANNKNTGDFCEKVNITPMTDQDEPSNNNNCESDNVNKHLIDTNRENNHIDGLKRSYSILRESIVCISTVAYSDVVTQLRGNLNCPKSEIEKERTVKNNICVPTLSSTFPSSSHSFVVDVGIRSLQPVEHMIVLTKGFASWCHVQHARHFSNARKVFRCLLLLGSSDCPSGKVFVGGVEEIDNIIGSDDCPPICDISSYFVRN